MSETERLRKILSERGVEYTTNDSEHVSETCWPYMGELMASFVEYDNGTTRFEMDHWCFTPEQAVEATLGRETCHVEGYDDGVDEGVDGEWYSYQPFTWYLDCGHEVEGTERPNFCPVCGKKVISE